MKMQKGGTILILSLAFILFMTGLFYPVFYFSRNPGSPIGFDRYSLLLSFVFALIPAVTLLLLRAAKLWK